MVNQKQSNKHENNFHRYASGKTANYTDSPAENSKTEAVTQHYGQHLKDNSDLTQNSMRNAISSGNPTPSERFAAYDAIATDTSNNGSADDFASYKNQSKENPKPQFSHNHNLRKRQITEVNNGNSNVKSPQLHQHFSGNNGHPEIRQDIENNTYTNRTPFFVDSPSNGPHLNREMSHYYEMDSTNSTRSKSSESQSAGSYTDKNSPKISENTNIDPISHPHNNNHGIINFENQNIHTNSANLDRMYSNNEMPPYYVKDSDVIDPILANKRSPFLPIDGGSGLVKNNVQNFRENPNANNYVQHTPINRYVSQKENMNPNNYYDNRYYQNEAFQNEVMDESRRYHQFYDSQNNFQSGYNNVMDKSGKIAYNQAMHIDKQKNLYQNPHYYNPKDQKITGQPSIAFLDEVNINKPNHSQHYQNNSEYFDQKTNKIYQQGGYDPQTQRPGCFADDNYDLKKMFRSETQIFDDDDSTDKKKARKTGRKKISMEYITTKNKRSVTFSKRKKGIMKKAYELSVLTKTQILLLVASESGFVYTFATSKFKPIIQDHGRLIQSCLNAPSTPPRQNIVKKENDDNVNINYDYYKNYDNNNHNNQM